MMKKIKISLWFIGFCWAASSVAASQHYSQYIVWKNHPIAIMLPVGQSWNISFPNSVEVGIPPGLQDALTVINNAGVLTFSATKRFSSQRVEIMDTATHHKILLDLTAAKHETTIPLAIFYKKPAAQSDSQPGWTKKPARLSGEMAYITLTRFAEQQLYAPKRLLHNPYGLHLINSFVDSSGNVPQSNWFYGLFIDNSTVGMPWAEWYGAGYYVTAVVVRNQLSMPINLRNNLTNLCGRQDSLWKSVAFFPAWRVEKAGNTHDTTVAFLVSKQPFDQAVNACKGQS